MLYYITCKTFPTILISGKKVSEIFTRPKFLQYSITLLSTLLGDATRPSIHAIYIARTRIRLQSFCTSLERKLFVAFTKKKTMYKYISFCMHKKLHILSQAQWRCQC